MPGMQYGLGLMQQKVALPMADGGAPLVLEGVGHGGMDWGSGAMFNSYFADIDASVVVATNGVKSMNCSLLDGSADTTRLASMLGQCATCTVARLKNASRVGPCGTCDAITQIGAGGSFPVDSTFCDMGGYDVCTGASAALPRQECAAWKSLFATTNGDAAWKACRGAFADPCGGCPGHVTCDGGHITAIELQGVGLRGRLRADGLGNLTQLTRLDLRGNSLFGAFPASLAALPRFAQGEGTLLLSGNLFSGPLPAVSYASMASQGGACDVRGNDWDCPLPAGAAKCGAVCDQGANISSACGRTLGPLYQSEQVQQHMQKLYQFASQRLQQATWGCQAEMQRNHTCHVSLDWSGGQAQQLVQAANAAIQAVDPSGAVCFLNSAKTAPCQGWHGPSGACRYTTGAGQPSLFGGSCTAQDRRAWAQWTARPSQCVQRGAQDCWSWPSQQFCGDSP